MLNHENKKLLKVTEDIFVEPETGADGKKPFEWRRDFNFVTLTLNNLKLINSFSVHEKEFDFDRLLSESVEEVKPSLRVKPNINSRVTIAGELNEESFRDSIYIAVPDSQEENIFLLDQARGGTKITLTTGQPTDGDGEKVPSGLYAGHATRYNHDDEDYLAFNLTLPAEQMNQIIISLKEDENSKFEIGALVRSYSFEVDDFFRDYNHPRDIIINDSTLCFVSWISISSKIGKHFISVDSENEFEDAEHLSQEELTLEQHFQQGQLRVLESYAKPLNKIANAVWILIIILIIQFIF